MTAAAVSVDANAGSKVCLLAKVFIPASAPIDAQYTFGVQGVMSYAASALPAATLLVNDLTKAADSTVSLVKAVVNTTTGGDGTTAQPGDILTYTLTYANTQDKAVQLTSVDDATPAFTTYVAASAACGAAPAGITCAVAQQPTLPATTGAVTWTFTGTPTATLQPGAQGTVTYQVQVAQ